MQSKVIRCNDKWNFCLNQSSKWNSSRKWRDGEIRSFLHFPTFLRFSQLRVLYLQRQSCLAERWWSVINIWASYSAGEIVKHFRYVTITNGALTSLQLSSFAHGITTPTACANEFANIRSIKNSKEGVCVQLIFIVSQLYKPRS